MTETGNTDTRMDEIEKLRSDVEKELRHAIAEEDVNLTFFIGNGLSRILNTPSWEELADKMLKKLANHQVINQDISSLLLRQSAKTKISIADAYFRDKKLLKEKVKENAIKELTYKSIIRNKITSESNLENEQENNPYKQLAKFAKLNLHIVSNFITTNYDLKLYEALGDEGLIQGTSKLPANWDPSKLSLKEIISNKLFYFFDNPEQFRSPGLVANKKILLYLHGSTKHEAEMIVSIKDYLKLYGQSLDGLKEVLEKQTIIIMGYGLNELEILELLYRNVLGVQEDAKIFLLLPYLSHEKTILMPLAKHWEELSITILPYNVDENWHEEINKIIETWIELPRTKELPRINRLDEIDKGIKSVEIDKEKNIEQVLDLIEDENDRIYFFQKIRSPQWFLPLKDRGWFETIDGEKNTQNAKEYHPWPPIFYLEHIANEIFKKKLSDPKIIKGLVSVVTSNFDKLGNIQNFDYIVKIRTFKILFLIPHHYLEVDNVVKAFSFFEKIPGHSSRNIFSQEALENLTKNLDKTPHSKDIVSKYIKLVFNYRRINHEMFGEQYELLYFDRYDFRGDKLKELKEQIFNLDRLDEKNKKLIESSIQIFDEKLNKLLTEDKELDESNGRWRPVVKEHYRNRSHYSASSLFLGILFFLSSWQLKNKKNLNRLDEWAKSHFITFKRLYLALAIEFPEIIPIGQSYEVFISESFDKMKGARYERYYYLKNFYSELTETQKEQVICGINKINHGEKEANILKQLEWLHASHALKKDFENTGNKIPDKGKSVHPHPEFSDSIYFRTQWGRTYLTSPLSKDNMLKMQPDKLIEYLKQKKFDPVEEWKRPRQIGLAENLKEYIKHKSSGDTGTIVDNLLELDYIYVATILDGLVELWKEKKTIPYKPALEKIRDLVKNETFVEQLSDEYSDTPSVISSVSKFIGAGVTNNKHCFKNGTYELSFEILETLFKNVKVESNVSINDALARAINEPKGQVIEALICLTSWQCKYENEKSSEHKNAWEDLKELIKLEIGKDGESSLHAILGCHSGWLSHMEEDWFYENLEKMAPDAKKHDGEPPGGKVCSAFMDGFSYTNVYIPKMYKELRSRGILEAYLRQEREKKSRDKNNELHNRIIDFGLIAYVSGDDEDLVNLILRGRQESEWSYLFNSIANIYGGEKSSEHFPKYLDKIKNLLEEVFKVTKEPDNGWKQHFFGLDYVLELFDDLSDNGVRHIIENIIKLVSKHAKYDWNLSGIIDYLYRHKDKHCKIVGELYVVMLENTSFAPCYQGDKIQEICEKLQEAKEQDSLAKICKVYEKRTVNCAPIRDICSEKETVI